MSLPYVQISAREALAGKKEILSSEINIINLVKRISLYKKLRKSEISKKISLKRAVKHEIARTNSLLRELPKVDVSGIREIETKKDRLGKLQLNKKKSLETELNEIREKLKKLDK